MDLSHQWTGRVNHSQTALLAGIADFWRDPVRAINDAFAFGDFVHRINENGSLAGKLFNHETVVNDFLAHVNRRPERLEGNADNINRAHHSGTKSSGLQQKQSFLALRQWSVL